MPSDTETKNIEVAITASTNASQDVSWDCSFGSPNLVTKSRNIRPIASEDMLRKKLIEKMLKFSLI